MHNFFHILHIFFLSTKLDQLDNIIIKKLSYISAIGFSWFCLINWTGKKANLKG